MMDKDSVLAIAFMITSALKTFNSISEVMAAVEKTGVVPPEKWAEFKKQWEDETEFWKPPVDLDPPPVDRAGRPIEPRE